MIDRVLPVHASRRRLAALDLRRSRDIGRPVRVELINEPWVNTGRQNGPCIEDRSSSKDRGRTEFLDYRGRRDSAAGGTENGRESRAVMDRFDK